MDSGNLSVSAFDEIYHQHVDVVFHFAWSLTNDEDLAKELTQEVFIKFWESRERMPAITSIRSYLLAMIKNQVLNYYRSESVRKRHFEALSRDTREAVQDDESSGEPMIEEYLRLTEKAIALLPAKRRKIFELSRREDLTYDQIAAALGLSKTVVKKQMLTALRDIRAYLALHQKTKVMVLLCLFWH